MQVRSISVFDLAGTDREQYSPVRGSRHRSSTSTVVSFVVLRRRCDRN